MKRPPLRWARLFGLAESMRMPAPKREVVQAFCGRLEPNQDIWAYHSDATPHHTTPHHTALGIARGFTDKVRRKSAIVQPRGEEP